MGAFAIIAPMKRLLKLVSFTFVLFSLIPVAHSTPPSSLNANDLLRYQQLTGELRCVVCQNQDLAESNTPLAAELRQQIATQLTQHQSNDQIKAYLSARYGEFILFKPSFSPKNYLLWLGPFALLLLALACLHRLLKKRQHIACQEPLSAQESTQLNRVLKP